MNDRVEYRCKIAKCCFSCNQLRLEGHKCSLKDKCTMLFYVCEGWEPHEPRTYYIDGVDDCEWSERFKRETIR